MSPHTLPSCLPACSQPINLACLPAGSHPINHPHATSSIFHPPSPSLLCGLVMAPIDKMAEQRLVGAAASGGVSSELLDPLMDME